MSPALSLVKYLGNLGYGTRREVLALVAQGRVADSTGRSLHSDALASRTDVRHDDLRVDGELLDPAPGSVLLMHKPVGYVCSARDASNPLVFDLLPSRFRLRTPKMVPVGRLDRDTSGLLLLTDDGALNHRLTSPRSHVAKVYDVTLAQPLERDAIALLTSGALTLANETDPIEVAELEMITATHVRLTLHEGRYHQARRMFAAVGNHVVSLHRSRVGGLALDALPSGAWRVLRHDEHALLTPSRVSLPRAL
jgi:16S rRNA pseudouridine516 synthase